MKFGFAPLNNASGVHPATLGRHLEERGFESVWMPEHSHIPTIRQTEYVAGGELPGGYYQMMNPFISLAAMIPATSALILATGVAQPLAHDLIDLAKTVATLDVLSGHRVILGAGAGWNREELANHRDDIPFERRYEALEERIAALRLIWSTPDPQFSGTWDSFTESVIDPKPRSGSIPIALGLAGAKGMLISARIADEWCPIDAFLRNEAGRHDVGFATARFRRAVRDAGRDPGGVPITMFYSGPVKLARLEACQAADIDRLVFLTISMDTDDQDATMRRLDEIAPYITK